jgi:hypothetical protein
MAQQVRPSAVAQLGGSPRRIDDVNEKDRSKDAIRFGSMAHASQEFLDLVDERVLVADEREMVVSGQFYKFGAWYVLGKIAAIFDAYYGIAATMKHQSWHPNRGENVPDIQIAKASRPFY